MYESPNMIIISWLVETFVKPIKRLLKEADGLSSLVVEEERGQ